MITERIISHLDETLLNAIRTADVEVLNELLHDDLLFIIPSGEVITKSQDLAAYASGSMQIESLVPSGRQISMQNDTAVVTLIVHLKAMYCGQQINGSFRYLRVWKRSGESWQIIAGSCVPLGYTPG